MAVKTVGTNWNRDTRNTIDENDKNLQRQINDLVLSSGESNAEVVQARGGESTLNDRLDKIEFKFSDIGNMSPKAVFSTLIDLENAYPNGSDGVFLVRDDGKWYFWNGIEWESGGTYQAQPWDEFMTEQNEEWVI